jgi:hypothetical protein
VNLASLSRREAGRTATRPPNQCRVLSRRRRLAQSAVVRALTPAYGLDREAIDAARRWYFRPGRRAGEPVPVLVSLEIEFNIH